MLPSRQAFIRDVEAYWVEVQSRLRLLLTILKNRTSIRVNRKWWAKNFWNVFIQQYIESQTQREVMFTWHGGETLMRPLSFYRKAVELQKKYARGRQIDNSIQTNGTLLNDDWCIPQGE